MQELQVLYKLEPTLRDVYVEGPSDAAFWRWFLAATARSRVGVFEIGMVEVPAEAVAGVGLIPNNRNRLIALAIFLCPKLVDPQSATCIVDSDFDCIVGYKVSCSCLVYTDYTSLEVHLLTDSVVEKFLCLYCQVELDCALFMRTSLSVLQELFLMRLAHANLGWNLEGLEIDRYLEHDEASGVEFDAQEYIRAYLNKNSRLSDAAMFSSEMTQLRPCLSTEPRRQIHGHDLVELLCWFALRTRDRVLSRAAIRRAVRAATEPAQLVGQAFFSKVLARVT